jgi:tRNA_anti-like
MIKAALILVAVLGLTLMGCGGSTRARNASSSDEQQSEPQSGRTVSGTYDAADLQSQYAENQVAADEKFGGKTIEVTGSVYDIKESSVQLGVTSHVDALFIYCYFKASERAKVGHLSGSDNISVTGQVRRGSDEFDISLDNCTIGG